MHTLYTNNYFALLKPDAIFYFPRLHSNTVVYGTPYLHINLHTKQPFSPQSHLTEIRLIHISTNYLHLLVTHLQNQLIYEGVKSLENILQEMNIKSQARTT